DDPDLLRIVHDTYLAEVVDRETEKPVPYGEVGELILTTLGRAGCPLLRYRTGDLVRSVAVLGEDPTAFALQGGILGRADDMVVVRGVNLYPSAIDAVVRSFDGIGEYQVTIDQTQPMVQVSIAAENESGGSDDVLIEKFEKQLREAFSLRIPVSVSASGSLPRFEMKARRWNVIG
ncbi:MAG: phenylacetate--CoA ligase family protein, partial [Opitutales bacterium]